MTVLAVSIMDIYPASYLFADRHRLQADNVDVNKLMISWFYPNGMNDTFYLT